MKMLLFISKSTAMSRNILSGRFDFEIAQKYLVTSCWSHRISFTLLKNSQGTPDQRRTKHRIVTFEEMLAIIPVQSTLFDVPGCDGPTIKIILSSVRIRLSSYYSLFNVRIQMFVEGERVSPLIIVIFADGIKRAMQSHLR